MPAVWSGDIDSTFEALQAQVRSGLNMALSGIPWWTTDIGGFYGGDIHAPSFRELVVRWFQYSAFCPLFRLHGYRNPERNTGAMIDTGEENEAWSFGDEAYSIIKGLLFLRERLRPYIEEQMQVASDSGVPPMRPLFFDFPEDSESFIVDDQFLLGPDLLVAPVLYEGARSRKVYLPLGTTWTDAWSGETLRRRALYRRRRAPRAHPALPAWRRPFAHSRKIAPITAHHREQLFYVYIYVRSCIGQGGVTGHLRVVPRGMGATSSSSF